ncbi:MAG TPA: PASTA domain-containing protein [Candidatus Baltobacteraceae bacterium]
MATEVKRSGPRWWQRLARQDWLLAVALAFFVGVAVWFARAIHDFMIPSAPQLVAPTLVGQTESDAQDEAHRLHLLAVVVEREASDRYPQDVVMSQEPVPGTAVREGRQISIVISSGVQIFAMPDLRFESMREVGLDMSRDKLLLGHVRLVDDEEIPSNHVVAQDPVPLTSVRVGTVVDLDVSRGSPSAVRVPKFVDLTIDQARDLATQQKIHLGQIVWTPFGRYGPPHGTVVRQNPGPDARIDEFDRVSLQVSAGPRESGYLVRQVHATATVPVSDKIERVRLEIRDETGTWNVFDAYAQPRQKLDFNLTVVGTSELDMYINNELVSSTTLGVEPSPLPSLPPDYGTPLKNGETPAADEVTP